MKVLNTKDTNTGVYIGRGSRWGNPFVIGIHGDRAEVIAQFKEYANARIKVDMNWLKPLVNQDLVCYCAPKACHGDFLLELILLTEWLDKKAN